MCNVALFRVNTALFMHDECVDYLGFFAPFDGMAFSVSNRALFRRNRALFKNDLNV